VIRHAHIRALVRMRSLNSILGSVRASKLLSCCEIGRFGMAIHLPSHCVLIVCDWHPDPGGDLVCMRGRDALGAARRGDAGSERIASPARNGQSVTKKVAGFFEMRKEMS